MSIPLGERRVTVGGALTALVLLFLALVAAVWLLSGPGDGRLVLAYGGAGLLLALGEIGFGLAAHRWLTPRTAARASLVVVPLLALLCFGFVRLLHPGPAIPDALVLAWIAFGTWTTWRTWRKLERTR